MPKKRCCPFCLGFNTKKKGFIKRAPRTYLGVIKRQTQRFYCNDCKKSFTANYKNKRGRYSKSFKHEAIKRFIGDKASYGAISSRLNVSSKSVWQWVNQAGEQCKGPLAIARELNPNWGGILGIDGKTVKIYGKKESILLAVDILTRDLVYYDVVEAENKAESKRFLLIVKEVIKYPIKAIVSDLGKGNVFIKLISSIFSDIDHQACVVHFDRHLDFVVPVGKKSRYYQLNRTFKRLVRNLLYADNFNDCEEIFIRLLNAKDIFNKSYHKTVLKSLEKNFDLLTAHFHNPLLPRDNNITENIVGQLSGKLDMVHSFGSRKNAYNFLKLWGAWYRFKPFSNSSSEIAKGKSPLQLAGVDTSGLDWLDFILN